MFCRICKANIFGKGVATFLKTIDATVQPLKFIPLSWSLAEEIEAIRKASGNVQYVYTFASLFVWKETEKYEICIGNGAFVVKNGAEGENAYLFPCGSAKGKKEIIDSLIEYTIKRRRLNLKAKIIKDSGIKLIRDVKRHRNGFMSLLTLPTLSGLWLLTRHGLKALRIKLRQMSVPLKLRLIILQDFQCGDLF